MLVDMAGSENIEAAGQTGFEAKMQVCDVTNACIILYFQQDVFKVIPSTMNTLIQKNN
jgi:hypothetical protein